MPAPEGLGARIGVRIDHAEQVHAALVDPAVEIVLRTRERLFDDQPQRAAGRGQARGDDALERCQHAPHRPALERAEARHALDVAPVLHAPRENGKRAARRLDVARKAQAVGGVGRRQRIDAVKRDIGFRTDLLQHRARVQLVLAGEDGLGRGARQPAALGHQRCAERALEFVMRQHPRPAMAARRSGLHVGEAVEVEGGHAELAQQAAAMKTAAVEAEAGALEPRVRQRVIVLVEQQADAACGQGGRQQAQRPPAQKRVVSDSQDDGSQRFSAASSILSAPSSTIRPTSASNAPITCWARLPCAITHARSRPIVERDR